MPSKKTSEWERFRTSYPFMQARIDKFKQMLHNDKKHAGQNIVLSVAEAQDFDIVLGDLSHRLGLIFEEGKPAPKKKQRTELSQEAKDARKPFPPDVMVGALQDRVDEDLKEIQQLVDEFSIQE